MEPEYISGIVALSASLSELAVKGTATAISNRVKAVKTEKDAAVIRATYDEIINELLNEREEAVRIAQAYKSELDRVQISDEDIANLHNTVSRILELVKDDNNTQQIESYEKMKELISIDTLKSMQLLGFNFKYAIGEPLTMLIRNMILSRVKETDSLKAFKSFTTPEMVEILKNDTAFSNLRRLAGINGIENNE